MKSPAVSLVSVYLGGLGKSDVGAALKSAGIGLTSVYLGALENSDVEFVFVNSPVDGLTSDYLEKLGKSDFWAALDERPILCLTSAYLVVLENKDTGVEVEKIPIDGSASAYLLLLGNRGVEAVLAKSDGVLELLNRPVFGLFSSYLCSFLRFKLYTGDIFENNPTAGFASVYTGGLESNGR